MGSLTQWRGQSDTTLGRFGWGFLMSLLLHLPLTPIAALFELVNEIYRVKDDTVTNMVQTTAQATVSSAITQDGALVAIGTQDSIVSQK